MTTSRSRWFTAIALMVPLLLFGAIEGIMRVAWPAGELPLFVTAAAGNGEWLMANPVVAARWFPGEQSPPAPNLEFFRATKAANGFRVFVLGESSAQGFPYPRTGSFARLLDAALTDALPDRDVEVITVGIAATNSYAMLDVLPQLLAQQPDAVLYYGGHNEFVGALGAGSAIRLAASPSLTRAFVALQQLRSVRALNRVVAQRRARSAAGAVNPSAASFMESVTNGQEVPMDGPAFRVGVQQFDENLTRIAERIVDAGVPLYIASTPANVRDQAPFASAGNDAARAAFAQAVNTLAAGDSGAARTAFFRARDLDVVRFRAPGVFDSVVARVVQRVAQRSGASPSSARVHYVPVAEAFAAQSPASAPGHELFLEHVHPNRAGVQLIANAFLTALRSAPPTGITIDSARLRTMAAYEQQVAVTPFDERIAQHRVAALAARWPFVAVAQQGDYRATYVPQNAADTLAFMVAGGARPWELAKLEVARRLEAAGDTAQAVQEYRGLANDQFIFAEPHKLAGAALFRARRFAEADTQFELALALEPSAELALVRARIAGDAQRWPQAVALLEQAQQLQPGRSDVLYQLALAQSVVGNSAGAHATARELQRLHPQFPALAQLLSVLGLSR
jgi:lysophospholipase L1-like esterase/Flp pilus assembly protein TadD